jgi:hypothetical protein
MRLMDRTNALIWGNELIRSKETLRLAVIAAGIRGDVVNIPFLIDMMQIPVHARVAGEAFTMITGVDLKDAQLEGCRPEGFEAGPNDDRRTTMSSPTLMKICHGRMSSVSLPGGKRTKTGTRKKRACFWANRLRKKTQRMCSAQENKNNALPTRWSWPY